MGVQGIGGLFSRARDPAALGAWYRQHLNVGAGCVGDAGAGEPNEWVWAAGGGPTVFQPFKADSDYFAADKQWMLNLRVTGLDALVAALEGAGVAVERRAEWNEGGIGRFARLRDPEGNAVELWEPAA